MCRELAAEYENEAFDFNKLAELHRQIAIFYDNIMKQIRPKPEYYRVSYYGKAFSKLLQNKTFIYRAKPYEKLFEFRSNLLSQFPNASLLESLITPGPETTEANIQSILINQVEPLMNEKTKEKFSDKQVDPQIQQYYEANEVQKFSFSRKKKMQTTDHPNEDNEFANMWLERTYLTTSYALPGILTWFPVIKTRVCLLSPIENAIEVVEKSNSKLKKTVLQHMNDLNLTINPLTMVLNGILDPAVNGGTSKYEEIFFTEDYLTKQNNNGKEEDRLRQVNRLKALIADQIPLLEVGVQVHRERTDISLQPLHNRLEELFAKMKESVQKKYGVSEMPPELAKFNAIKLRNLEIKNRHLNRYSGTESTHPQSVSGKLNHMQTQSSFELSKYNSMMSLSNTVKKTKSALVRHSNMQNAFPSPNLSLNSTAIHSLFSGTSKLRDRKNKENSTSSITSNGGLNGSFSAQNNSATTMATRKSSNHSTFYVEAEDATTNGKAKSTNDLRNGNPIYILREQLKAQRPLRSDVYENKRSNSRPSSGSNYLQVYRNSLSHGNSSTSLSPQCSEHDSKSEESTASNSLTNIENTNNGITPALQSSLSTDQSIVENQLSLPQLDDNEESLPPPLPKKHHSTFIENSSKFMDSSTNTTSPLGKQRNSCSSLSLKKKPPALPPNTSLSNLNSKSPLSIKTTNGYHLTIDESMNGSLSAYEFIPPINSRKKLFRPVPAIPDSSSNSEKDKPKENSTPNGTNNGETEL